MIVAFHFDLRAVAKIRTASMPGWGIARQVMRSLLRHNHWQEPVDLYRESFLLHQLAYRRLTSPLETEWTAVWDQELFEELKKSWLESLQSHWFHFGAPAELNASSLRNIFVVLLKDIDKTVVERIVSDLTSLGYYHSAFEVDTANVLHMRLYLESLRPRYVIINRSEATILLEVGGDDVLDVMDGELLRKCRIRQIHYDEYLPWDYDVRTRIPDCDLVSRLGLNGSTDEGRQ